MGLSVCERSDIFYLNKTDSFYWYIWRMETLWGVYWYKISDTVVSTYTLNTDTLYRIMIVIQLGDAYLIILGISKN